MKNPIAILNNIQLGKPNTLLVLHHDGFAVEGAVVHAGLLGQEVQASARSRAIDWTTAVSEIIDELKKAGVKKMPKKAILVSASAIAALIDLPVSPERPRTPDQMRELVRWELEPLFTQQHDHWSIGALLMGRGYLSQEQRAHVMSEVLSRNAASNNRMTQRFGEVVQSLDYATRAHIDECLELQERLVQLDDEAYCGWAAQALPEDSEIDEEAPRYPWLASGIGDNVRRLWVKACQRNKLVLHAIYPSLGVGFESLGKGGGREELLVDIQQEQFAVVRGQPGAMRAYRVGDAIDGEVVPEQVTGLCHEEMRPDIKRIVLNATGAVYAPIAALLEERMERPVIALATQTTQKAEAA